MKMEKIQRAFPYDCSLTLSGGFWGHGVWLRNNWSRRQDAKLWCAGKDRWGTRRR